jgi:hypothetical protein
MTTKLTINVAPATDIPDPSLDAMPVIVELGTGAVLTVVFPHPGAVLFRPPSSRWSSYTALTAATNSSYLVLICKTFQ